MTTGFFCVLIASILPIVWVGYAKYYLGFKIRDNSNPRELLGKAHGKGQRADWAQKNSWEAFAPFAAAVIIASIANVPQDKIDMYASVFIGARIAYGICYIQDLATIRSIVWSIGMACNFALYYFAWQVN